ncbi:hypothetical protein PS918_02425 [Pseudomonas fluorescens]|uniref:Gamma-butyrobetaine hydroxylase-like N-terminal domain-containing protein n=1 Tax=Pseudomonas fluorescens TaxID=294 RepID=A0A5E7S8M9_PSEFL|nr:gamma-butyrobetaine hydroxylase-like domain-containing protein [Pseudomonas fluorescens]VVP82390.1 hypothetical protein PS918_02425 [Pseudomonas fluorescens]
MNPLAVGNSRSKQQLRLSWPDGREQVLGHAELRRQCPCSQCRAFRLRGMTPMVDERVSVIELNPQGYGVQLVFSDGHERGIYPWLYLAQLTTGVT